MLNEQPNELSPLLGRELLISCGCFNLRKASRLVTQLYDDILQPTGLRSTQVVILGMLAVEQEISLTRLARELVLSPSTLHRNLLPLERDGLVESSTVNNRGRMVKLSESGQQTLFNALPYWHKAQEKFVGLVGVEAWNELVGRLGNTVTAVRS
jgi:DNA-binding MarR family transcriptional regulator